MFIVDILSWWYTAGWRRQLTTMHDRLGSLADYFSIDLLLRTLFAPFRQISAGKVRGSLSVQLRAWLDRVLSRCIGAMIRSFMIIIGVVALTVAAVIHTLGVVIWAVVPLLPFIGIGLMISGWVPWQSL